MQHPIASEDVDDVGKFRLAHDLEETASVPRRSVEAKPV